MNIQNILKENKLNALLVTKPENVRYLTNFIGSFGQAIATKSATYLITDPRYALQAKTMCNKDVHIVIIENYEEDIKKILKKHRVKNIGIEDTNLTYSTYLKFKKILKEFKLYPLGHSLDHERLIKSKKELELIIKSQQINEKTLKQVLKLLKPGVKEKDLAWKIVDIGHQLGAEDISFVPIVAFGENSASPHYTPAERKYKKSDVVLIDMGMKYQGYCSDMTRTFLPKKAPTSLIDHYEIVLSAQENCIQNVRAGDKGSRGDLLSRDVFAALDLDQYFTHANGHGVGLEIHEAPSLSSKQKHADRTMKLEEDMVVTVEPGIYLEGKYGIRIEDMIVIGRNENKNLTKFPKQLKSILI
jgi:Xaa-Pro aminopeptidase